MPRWSRDRDALRDRYPDERWIGSCARASADLLLRHDHHVVWIGGRPALLLTCHWAVNRLDFSPEPLTFEVNFTYSRGHPPAPPQVQAVVDGITFSPPPSRDTPADPGS